MRPFLPGKLLHLVFQYLFFMLRPPQSDFALGKLPVELFQLSFITASLLLGEQRVNAVRFSHTPTHPQDQSGVLQFF